MAMRDSRFGQFADPAFGAGLSHSGPSDAGVLPSPDQGTSASNNPPEQPTEPGGGGGGAPQQQGFSGMPGLMPQPGGSNRGSVYLAQGGMIPGEEDDTQDSGNAAPPPSDPFSVITAALAQGRKKFGLPPSFFGGTAQPADPEMPEPDSFAEGGEVEEDTGVIPSGEQEPAQQGTDPQGAIAYLKGDGAVGPEIAAALEQQVDPQGTMPSAQRRQMAVAAAGDPDKAFQVMQHYRQKFNAYGAFAKAALQGAGGRPPNPASAADALNKAYDHVPDGKQLTFAPVQGGMRVSIGGGDQRQEQIDNSIQKPQQFAEGGLVEDQPAEPDMAEYTTAGKDQLDVMPAYGEGQRSPHEMVRDFVLSIPALLGWQSKDGQFDSAVDKGVESTLGAASKGQGPPGVDPNAGTPVSQSPQQQPAQRGPVLNQEYQTGVENDRNKLAQHFAQPPGQGAGQDGGGGAEPAIRRTPENAEKFGSQVGTKGGQEGHTLADVLHEIDQAYPSVGMAQQRALARAAARQHWADNHVKIEAEQTKSGRAENVAKIAAGARTGVADTNAAARVTSVGMQQDGAGKRNENTVAGRERVADKAQAGQNNRFNAREKNLTDRNIVTQKPGTLGSPEKMEAARKAAGPVNQVQQPGGQQQETDRKGQKLVNGKWYKRGPNGEAVLVP